MPKTIAKWESARILRHSPGTRGLAFVLCLPLLHLLPWGGTDFFESSFQAAVMLSSLFALVVACTVGRDAGSPRRSAFWLYQKGVQPIDYALGAFLVTLGLVMLLILAGSLVLTLGLVLRGEAVWRTVAAVLVVSVLLSMVVHVIVFAIASLGVSRTTETALALVFLAVFVDPVLLRAPAWLRRAAHWLLPPVSDAFHATSALFTSDWHTALGHLTHVLLFLAIGLAVAAGLQARLVPAPARLRAP
jgi:hypothetical protein